MVVGFTTTYAISEFKKGYVAPRLKSSDNTGHRMKTNKTLNTTQKTKKRNSTNPTKNCLST
jgi:hypothetical protein